MVTKPVFFILSAIFFLTSISFSAQSQVEEADAYVVNVQSNIEEVEEPERAPLEENVVTAKRRSLINLGDLFASDPEPNFVEPEAMRVESEKLLGGRRQERFLISDKMYCFKIREANPLDSWDNGNVFQRRC
ncbi:MAG: hypothetical protein P8J68_04170 [Arenicellaceae bacterium]|nr:hypothetical protein [Arenicellaceae bacterium]